MKLFDNFKIQKPENQSEHYELYVEGDWNDADYVNTKVSIKKEDFENDDFLLYFISFISTWAGRRGEGYFNETEDWMEFFDDDDIQCEYLPHGYESDIHTITEVKLEYVSGTTRYPVSIPSWGCLFKDEDEKRTKVMEAKNKDEGF